MSEQREKEGTEFDNNIYIIIYLHIYILMACLNLE